MKIWLLALSLAIAAAKPGTNVEVVSEPVDVAAWNKILMEFEVGVRDFKHPERSAERRVKLKEGRFSDPEGTDNRLQVQWDEPRLFLRVGDKPNEKIFAVAVIGVRYGGSGYFQTMKKIRIYPAPVVEAGVWPEFPDREPIENLRFESGKIVVTKQKHKAGEPACCPTGEEVLKFPL